VTLGTRGSALARAQTELVAALLASACPGVALSTQVLSTAGDRTQESGQPLPEIGGKGLFTAELERALLEGEIDVAVHSLKDLPTQDAPGVAVGAVTSREDVRDCLVSRSAESLSDLDDGALVGTSSLRRSAQLAALRPDLEIRSIRGNVDTRIRKVHEGEYDAALLAAAGIRRLGLEHAVSEWLSPETMLPAPGQGALAVQCRADDATMREVLADLDDPATRAETTAERAFLEALGSGCAAPVAALAIVTTTPRVRLQGLVASVDGRDVVRVRGEGDPAEVGARLAQEALSLGADRILRSVR
jgi:hydroxymethylbilane synthase